MCYYDNYKFSCNDWKWGNFRQNCQREYRDGKTCGVKMVFQTVQLGEKCTMCEKIEHKKRRLEKHKADYQRWSTDSQKYRFSKDKAVQEMRTLAQEIAQLMADKETRYRMIGNSRRSERTTDTAAKPSPATWEKACLPSATERNTSSLLATGGATTLALRPKTIIDSEDSEPLNEGLSPGLRIYESTEPASKPASPAECQLRNVVGSDVSLYRVAVERLQPDVDLSVGTPLSSTSPSGKRHVVSTELPQSGQTAGHEASECLSKSVPNETGSNGGKKRLVPVDGSSSEGEEDATQKTRKISESPQEIGVFPCVFHAGDSERYPGSFCQKRHKYMSDLRCVPLRTFNPIC